MTATNSATTTPAVPAALVPATATSPAPRRRTDTPGRMRIVGIVTAIVAALYGIIGSSVVSTRTGDLDRARDAAAQLERLEAVRSAVVEADSLAASAYLSGGLEAPERRATYEERQAAAQAGLIDASAGATTSESGELSTVAARLTAAGGLVEQARANSRQGFPVGAAYQRTSSALIRSDVLPVLDEIATATADRAAAAVDRSGRAQAFLWVSALAALGAIVAASAWLLRRTRRVFNVGLVAGGLLVSVLTVFTSSTLASTTATATDTLNGPYAAATSYARARTAAFDARSNEALTLIARGNGGAFEQRWQEQALAARNELERAVGLDGGGVTARDAFEEYAAVHTDIRALDDGGSYAEAVQQALAIGTRNANGTPADGFARFDDESAEGLARFSRNTDSGLSDASGNLSNHRWLVLVAGLLAAGACFGGVARRIQEYR